MTNKFRFEKVSAFFLALTFVFSAASVRADTGGRYDLVYERALHAISQGDRDLAIRLLKDVVQLNPNSAGAWFDLGLLYCDASLSEQAEEAFAVLERRFQLPALIQQTISERRRKGCGVNRFDYQITYQVAAGAASNANIAPSSPLVQIGFGPSAVILELSEKFRPKADNFLDLGLQIQGPKQEEKNKLLLLVSARRHTQLRDYDFTNILGAYSYTTSFDLAGQPALVLTGIGSQSTLAGRPFDQTGRVAIDGWINSGERTAANSSGPRLGFGVIATANRYDQDPEYNALRFEGLFRYEVTISKDWLVQSQIGSLTDRALNGRPGGDRRGWSGVAEVQRNQGKARTLIGFSGQITQDERPYSAVFFPGLIRETRRFIATVRHDVPAEIIHPALPAGRIFFQATFDDLSDSIPIFSFKNQIFTIGFIKKL